MKKAFRAALAVLFALVFAVVTMSALVVNAGAAPVFSTPNLANPEITNDASVAADNSDGDRVATNAVDGNESTSWQSNDTDKQWFKVNWKNAKNVQYIVIAWAGDITKIDSVEYEGENGPISLNEENNGISINTYDGRIQVIKILTDVSTKEIKINFSGSWKEGCNDLAGRVAEIEVYGDKPNYIVADLEAAYKNVDIGDNNIYGYTDESWQNFINARNSAKQAIEDCKEKQVDSVTEYKQEDLYSLQADLNTAVANLKKDTSVEGQDNVLYGGLLYYRTYHKSEVYGNKNASPYDCDKLNVFSLTDGDFNGEGGNSWHPYWSVVFDSAIYIRLAKAADINKIVIYGGNQEYKFDISYISQSDMTNVPVDFAGYDKLSWQQLGSASGCHYDKSTERYIYEFYLDTTVSDVAAIKIIPTDAIIPNKGNGLHELRLFEVEAYSNAEAPAPVFVESDICAERTGDGVKDVFLATGVNKENLVSLVGSEESLKKCKFILSYKVEYKYNKDNEEKTNTNVLSEAKALSNNNAYSRIVFENDSIMADATKGYDYVTGFMFTNLKDKYTITYGFQLVDENNKVIAESVKQSYTCKISAE